MLVDKHTADPLMHFGSLSKRISRSCQCQAQPDIKIESLATKCLSDRNGAISKFRTDSRGNRNPSLNSFILLFYLHQETICRYQGDIIHPSHDPNNPNADKIRLPQRPKKGG